MSGHPGPPWDVLSALSSVAKRDLGESKDLSDTTKSNQSREAAWMRWEPATTSPVPHLLSLPIISRHLAVSRQNPWVSYCLLSCALPYLRSIFHVRRSHVSGYLWPWGPGSAALAALQGWEMSAASPLKHCQEPKSILLCRRHRASVSQQKNQNERRLPSS